MRLEMTRDKTHIQRSIHVDPRDLPDRGGGLIRPSELRLRDAGGDVNLLPRFERRRLLHVGHGAAEGLASEAEGDAHVAVVLEAVDYPDAVARNVFPAVLRRRDGSLDSHPVPHLNGGESSSESIRRAKERGDENPSPYLEALHLLHVGRIGLPRARAIRNVDYEEAVALYVDNFSDAVVRLSAPSVSRLRNRSLHADLIADLQAIVERKNNDQIN